MTFRFCPPAIAALFLGLLGFLLSVATDARAAEPEGSLVLRVLCYNIRHGVGLDGRLDLERVAAVITNARPDLVALQEVDRGVERTQRRDLPSELARLTGLSCVFSNNHSHQGGDYGNALLSRLPVLSWTNLHLRASIPGEQRGLLIARVRAGTRELGFMVTHLDHRSEGGERLAGVAQLREALAGLGALPVIAAGDFNDVPGSATHARMKEVFLDAWEIGGEGDGFTVPVNEPRRRIDYVWLRKVHGLRVRHAEVIRSEASDHLPLLIEVALDP